MIYLSITVFSKLKSNPHIIKNVEYFSFCKIHMIKLSHVKGTWNHACVAFELFGGTSKKFKNRGTSPCTLLSRRLSVKRCITKPLKSYIVVYLFPFKYAPAHLALDKIKKSRLAQCKYSKSKRKRKKRHQRNKNCKVRVK